MVQKGFSSIAWEYLTTYLKDLPSVRYHLRNKEVSKHRSSRQLSLQMKWAHPFNSHRWCSNLQHLRGLHPLSVWPLRFNPWRLYLILPTSISGLLLYSMQLTTISGRFSTRSLEYLRNSRPTSLNTSKTWLSILTIWKPWSICSTSWTSRLRECQREGLNR